MKHFKLFSKLILFLFLFYRVHSDTTIPLLPQPSENCLSHCGSVQIPYPYGIGKGCYWKKSYEIVCNTTINPHKPYLKLLQLEVLNIDLRSYVTTEDESGTSNSLKDASLDVKMPVFSMACSTKKGIINSFNLTGTPYLFSSSNQLTVIGCDLRAMVTNVGSQFVGCRSSCDATKDQEPEKNMMCDGNKCCQTLIPSRLQVFTVEIEHVNETLETLQPIGQCQGVASLTYETFSLSNVSSPKDVQTKGYMSVKLDWFIDDYVVDSNDNDAISCSYTNSASISSITYNYSACQCQNGYNGNPHILDGCQDIDECKIPRFDGSPRCGKQICKNTKGYYKCETKKTLPIILGLSLGLGLFIMAIGLWRLVKFIKKRNIMKRKMKLFKRNGGLLLQQRLNSSSGNVEKTKIFTSKELENATDKFSESRILGQGGQGTVYKGMLLDGRIVAVKKSKVVDEEKLDEFINEIVILSQIDHRNIVKLLGCCLETEVPVLVYEFVPNGDLFHHLHDESEEFPMNWETRLTIASEIAAALSYLHSAASVPIYHRDIKSTNILLDEKYRAKISDFGTSRSITIDDTHKTMTFVIGTFGYIDPEYIQSNRFTAKSDVYSFGVVLVELLTGKKSIFSSGTLKGTPLAVYFSQKMKANRLSEIVDPRIKENDSQTEITSVANLARVCLRLNGKKRPTMKEVAMDLERICNPKADSPSQIEYKYEEEAEEEDLIINMQDSLGDDLYTCPILDRDTTLSLDSDPLVFYNTS